MRRQDAGVEIPAGARVDFAPDGYHFMLRGLKQPLAAGQKIPVTLVFDLGRQLTVQLAVRTTEPQAAQGTPAGHAHHQCGGIRLDDKFVRERFFPGEADCRQLTPTDAHFNETSLVRCGRVCGSVPLCLWRASVRSAPLPE
ncbi:copper chaperone PCu(A)C [Caulobacter sp. HMWF009]|uniref:copper chaperone PCu(A)C n=1 Tax=unclassified Caulobacter TaxID=2648921 RepID=UPI000D344DDA|nr:hypothetical protein DBR21_17040 [Caulobacter sp. HMWF009]PTT10550.1 hypothetical protein DBR10_05245 [Caulobacter sp. HMWF025]